MSLDQHDPAYLAWLWALQDSNPDCEIVATSFGCEVRRDNEIVSEYDYDPHPPERERY